MNAGTAHGTLMITRFRTRTAAALSADIPYPTTVNPLGIKGVGEAGTIGSTPAVVNSGHRRAGQFGVVPHRHALRPEKLWTAMHGASNGVAR